MKSGAVPNSEEMTLDFARREPRSALACWVEDGSEVERRLLVLGGTP